MAALVDLGLGLLLVASAVLIVVCAIRITKDMINGNDGDKK